MSCELSEAVPVAPQTERGAPARRALVLQSSRQLLKARNRKLRIIAPSRNNRQQGSAWGPVILPVFKTGARRLRDVVGAFDSHTLPPIVFRDLPASFLSACVFLIALYTATYNTTTHRDEDNVLYVLLAALTLPIGALTFWVVGGIAAGIDLSTYCQQVSSSLFKSRLT